MPQLRSGDTVKVHYTGRFGDGRVFDTSHGQEPIEVTVGEGRVIPGFEQAVASMEPGEEKTVTIPADQAYGPHRAELLVSIDREQFPEHIEPRVGQQLQVRRNDGEQAVVKVADISPTHVTLDANHPLAGEDLTFDLQLVEVLPKK